MICCSILNILYMKIVSLIKISHFLYFFICMILLSFVLLYQKSGDIGIHVNIFLLFTLVLLPLFDFIFEMFFPQIEFKKIMHHKKKSIAVVWLTILMLVALLTGYLSGELWIVLAMAYILILWWDTRIFFMGALVLFLYIAFFLIFNESALSEKLSVYAYYLLVAGVLMQIIESIKSPNIPNT